MMSGKNDDTAQAREDSFLAELIPQVTEHLAAQHAEDFDAETGQARFETWIAANTDKAAVPAEGPAGAGYGRPAATGWVKRLLIRRRLRRRETTGKNASRKRRGTKPARAMGDPAERSAMDRWQARPYDMQPAPERAAVMARVEQLTGSLAGAIDEGTGASLDLLIESWSSSWIAAVESEHVDHCAAISMRRGLARQRLTESTIIAVHEREQLDRIGAAYEAWRLRFGGELADRAIGGRSRTGLAAAVLLVLAGALAVTVAFRSTLALALPSLSGVLAWLTAAGATSLALVAAASVGISLAIPGQGGRRALITVGWIGLGLATVLTPLLGTGALFTPAAALFSSAIYLTSGATAMFLSEKLYEPGYFGFRQLARQYAWQAMLVAKAEAGRDRAEAVLELHDGELQREDQLRAAAIADRKALAAEAANYARVMMAAMLRDPAKTGLTKAGPVPEPMPELHGENCTILLTDVVAFGAPYRTDEDRRLIREALFEMQTSLLPPSAWSEDRGDGFLTVIPPTVPTTDIMERLDELAGELEEYDSTYRESARFKLRAAVSVGPVFSDSNGVSGEAIMIAARLVEAPAFKTAIDRGAGSLGIIAPPFVYEMVIRHSSDQAALRAWSQVPVEVKGTNDTAWMRISSDQTRSRGSSDDSYEIRSRRG